MSCLTTARRAELNAELALIEASLTAARAAQLANYDKPASYRLDTGEGSQQVKSRTVGELRDEIRFLQGEKRNIDGKLNGRGLTFGRIRR